MAIVTVTISTFVWIAIEEKKVSREIISWNGDKIELRAIKWFVKTIGMVRVKCKVKDWTFIASWIRMVAVETTKDSLKANLEDIRRITNLKVVRLNKLKVRYDYN